MYIHLGQSVVVPDETVIGVFDMDNTTTSRVTRGFLAGAEKRGSVVNVSEELPKSFIITDGKIYLSQLSSATIAKRSEESINGRNFE
jgi:hypothetical protein